MAQVVNVMNAFQDPNVNNKSKIANTFHGRETTNEMEAETQGETQSIGLKKIDVADYISEYEKDLDQLI